MATSPTYTASCKSVSRIGASNWTTWDAAYQGSYNKGDSRLGCMLFSKLRNEVKWQRAKISKITLTITFGGAGGNAEKTLYLHRGTQTSFTGTGTAMKGDAIGNVKTNGKAYNTTNTITFDANTNATAFANLAAWLNEGDSLTLVVYHEETSAASAGSTNYLQINAASIVVEYSTSPVHVYDNDAWINTEVNVFSGGQWLAGEVNPIPS